MRAFLKQLTSDITGHCGRCEAPLARVRVDGNFRTHGELATYSCSQFFPYFLRVSFSIVLDIVFIALRAPSK